MFRGWKIMERQYYMELCNAYCFKMHREMGIERYCHSKVAVFGCPNWYDEMQRE